MFLEPTGHGFIVITAYKCCRKSVYTSRASLSAMGKQESTGRELKGEKVCNTYEASVSHLAQDPSMRELQTFF